jgi:hypothetical protein
MTTSRLLIVVFGALPASVLGSFAVGVGFGGFRGLGSFEISGALFVGWTLLGLTGVGGLWLAAILGPGSRTAAGLIACGLAADAVLLGVAAANWASPASPGAGTLDRAYVALLSVPFLVGAAYICHALICARRLDRDGHPAV